MLKMKASVAPHLTRAEIVNSSMISMARLYENKNAQFPQNNIHVPEKTTDIHVLLKAKIAILSVLVFCYILHRSRCCSYTADNKLLWLLQHRFSAQKVPR